MFQSRTPIRPSSRQVLGAAPAALALLLGALLAAFASSVAADPLFSFTTARSANQPGITSSVSTPIHFYGDLGTRIFANHPFYPGDVGSTLTIDRFSDPNFAAFTAEFTDGSPENMLFSFVPAPALNAGGPFFPEAYVAFGSYGDARVDLHGQTISCYTLRLDALDITNDTVTGRSSFTAKVTFTAYSTPLPEPASVLLLAAGAMALASRRRPRI